MKNLKMSFILFGILFSTLLHSQVLTIVEQDQDGHSYVNKQISDINSRLEINVDKTKLWEILINKQVALFPSDLSNNISTINDALKGRQESLNKVEEAIGLLKNGDFDGYVDELKNAAKPITKLLKDIPGVEQAFLDIQTKNNDYSNPVKDAYEAAERVLKVLTDKLDGIAKENGVYVQMGCWLITKNEQRQIHLEGFDNIPALAEYEVPRWQFAPSEAERTSFDQFKKLAEENAEKGPEVILQITQQQFISLENRLESYLKKDITELLAPVANSLNGIKDDTGNIKKGLETIKTTTGNYVKFISEKTEKYKNIGTNFKGDLSELIVSSKIDYDAIEKETQTLLETIETQVDIINTSLTKLPRDVQQEFTQALAEIKQIGPRVKTMVQDWTSKFKNSLDELLKGRNFDMAALEFSEEVDKLDIANIPEKTVISLAKTGYRENGDKFAVKMIVASAKANAVQLTETHELTLFMVLPHVRSIAGLIFAQSTDKTEKDAKFRMAPSYNILFKGFWDKKLRRKSVIYNRLLDFSFGLNLASLDFNNDDAQELGVGLVISGISDYIQIGYGYNITEKKPYWFFGLRLPLIPVVNLSNYQVR